jgi:ABC-type polysaccharide/polyol phosphate transport system ATPase subunit
MSSEPAIRVRGLSKTYRLYRQPKDRLKQYLFGGKRRYFTEVQALRDISFSVAQGETIGIIGKNGSGKSTLLQALCGILAPSGGQVVANGRLCAMLELGAGFNPEFTGKENVFLNARLLGMNEEEIESRYPAIVSFADIGEFINKPLRCYSSGMYVRLAFAVAAHTDPDILLIDEVLSVGDVFFQQKCNLYMQRELGKTAKILVTHSMEAVASMTTRVLVLDKGSLAFDGPPLQGIETFMRLSRRENALAGLPRPRQAAAAKDAPPSLLPIPPDKLSGALSAVFTGFTVEVNGTPYGGCILAGAPVAVTLLMEVRREISHPIVGYLLADRFGNFIFGQNTTTAGLPLDVLRPGAHRICLHFTWPDVAGGDYFLTPGLGNGLDSKAHDIECWAHNIFHFSAVTPHKDVHGLFNGSLHQVECTPLSEMENEAVSDLTGQETASEPAYVEQGQP